MMTAGSVGNVVPLPKASSQMSAAPTSCIPVVTTRLPTRRLASAEKMSSVPHGESGTETGEEAEGHRRSLAARLVGRSGVARVGTRRDRPAGRSRGRPVLHSDARGDVAQLGEHRVRIAGVRGSSPLISTIPRHGPRSRIGGSPVSIVAAGLVALVALIHVYILVLEMVLWRTDRGRKAFGTTVEQAETMATLAANQGLYNGFLAAGLFAQPGPAGADGVRVQGVLPRLRHRGRRVRRPDRVAPDPRRPGAPRGAGARRRRRRRLTADRRCT